MGNGLPNRVIRMDRELVLAGSHPHNNRRSIFDKTRFYSGRMWWGLMEDSDV